MVAANRGLTPLRPVGTARPLGAKPLERALAVLKVAATAASDDHRGPKVSTAEPLF